jgi:hypothetical protein
MGDIAASVANLNRTRSPAVASLDATIHSIAAALGRIPLGIVRIVGIVSPGAVKIRIAAIPIAAISIAAVAAGAIAAVSATHKRIPGTD